MMIARLLRLGAVGVVALVLQVGLFDQVVVGYAHVDLLIVLAAASGVVLGSEEGATVAFFLGLIADLAVELPFGLSGLCFVLVAFGTGLAASATTGRDRHSADVALCVVGSGLGTILYALLGALLGQPSMLGASTAVTVLVVVAGAIVLGYPCLAALRWATGSAAARSLAVPNGGSALR